MLSQSVQDTLESLSKREGTINLYEETSFSGKSETLRYKRVWAEMGKWGLTQRCESHMILSVKIHVFVNKKTGTERDDPKDIEKYATMCKEARGLFEQLRIKNNPNK